MPIDYSKYPENWKSEIRPRILARAENKCECCGVLNYDKLHSFKENGITVWRKLDLPWKYFKGIKPVKVVLTIAHLDHDECNCNVTDDRLKAMCQLCHLRYDSEEKKKRKKLNKTKPSH